MVSWIQIHFGMDLLFGNGNEQISFLCPDCPDGINASISFLWQDIFFNKTSLLIFGPIPWQRNLRTLFAKVGIDSRLNLFCTLADEVRYDIALSFDLCSTYEAFVTKSGPTQSPTAGIN
jgi:hypothetical protein